MRENRDANSPESPANSWVATSVGVAMTMALAVSASGWPWRNTLDFNQRFPGGLDAPQTCNAGFQEQGIAQARGDGARQRFHALAKGAQPGARRALWRPRSSWRRAERFHIAASNSCSLGNAARRLKFSGSPAYTPETKGATSRSSNSSPNLRRTNAAMDSSSAGGRCAVTISVKSRHFVPVGK